MSRFNVEKITTTQEACEVKLDAEAILMLLAGSGISFTSDHKVAVLVKSAPDAKYSTRIDLTDGMCHVFVRWTAPPLETRRPAKEGGEP